MKFAITQLLCWWACSICAQSATPVIQISATDISCAGLADGRLEVTLFGGALPVDFQWTNLNTGAQGIGQFLVTNQPILLTGLNSGLYRFQVTGSDGADTMVQRLVNEPLSLKSQLVLKSAGNGYDLQCANSQDGAILVNVIGGTMPFFYHWSNGDSGYFADSLPAGPIAVTITDARGCSISADSALVAPPPILTQIDAEGETCFGQNSGAIALSGVSGGVPPYEFALNTAPAGSQMAWTDLAPGQYFLSTIDAGGCLHQDGVILPTGLEFTLKLGADTTLMSGDTMVLNLEINPPADTVIWYPLSGVQVLSPTQALVSPFLSTTFAVTAISSDGCVSNDAVNITVSRHRDVYVPNVIEPSAQLVENQFFTAFTGPGIRTIQYLQVYDRFGRLWFDRRNIPANDPAVGWSGADGQDEAPAGVYLWRLCLQYTDGREEQLQGDVTVLR
ncbi:MAG: hypothetical protein IT260_17890 [Saprospiraceae bacterium]|nr:hypothetical protein [Saprospiraceae bacterium]